jgi:methylated-DNA-protein-cysteine methyltransferase-like protein
MPFSSPPDPKAYAEQVFTIVATIPPGRVMTYGQVALLIPPPPGVDPADYVKLSPRWVGSAMAQAPETVPWQRVINSQGKISLRPGIGAQEQRHRLESEGVVFDARDRVDLKVFGWQPGQEDGRPAQLL